ncbi:hypothetical protein N7519_010838 [Penicillium mononematosum]|uniref:uncharacterized protein n=1 Tax=Penicillium mononematosum TaxID=268346 RepID=UPI0025471675|nr:uncharacterized protein N7519_010838 [Penicillium mononematosum]KAJ6180377.1 hypothetical protein N7519_010838 [Penicillium mononematosum]
MFFKSLDLTTALRPLLLPDEILLFVQDAVGLYEGKYKIQNYQNGHAYLTSHRVCYVAAEDPRKYSVAIDLKEIDRVESQAGFLKSSPKLTIYPKPQKKKTDKSRSATASPAVAQQSVLPQSLSHIPQTNFQHNSLSPKPINATWICPICSFSNPVPSNFDPATANAATNLPPCLACGIKPPFTAVLKAAISAVASRESPLLSSVASPAIAQDTDQSNANASLSHFGSGELSLAHDVPL